MDTFLALPFYKVVVVKGGRAVVIAFVCDADFFYL